jgi:hypothetical protein
MNASRPSFRKFFIKWRVSGAPEVRPEKGPGDRPSAQRLEHARQFGKSVITQAPALTSGIVLAEGAIA